MASGKETAITAASFSPSLIRCPVCGISSKPFSLPEESTDFLRLAGVFFVDLFLVAIFLVVFFVVFPLTSDFFAVFLVAAFLAVFFFEGDFFAVFLAFVTPFKGVFFVARFFAAEGFLRRGPVLLMDGAERLRVVFLVVIISV